MKRERKAANYKTYLIVSGIIGALSLVLLIAHIYNKHYWFAAMFFLVLIVCKVVAINAWMNLRQSKKGD